MVADLTRVKEVIIVRADSRRQLVVAEESRRAAVAPPVPGADAPDRRTPDPDRLTGGSANVGGAGTSTTFKPLGVEVGTNRSSTRAAGYAVRMGPRRSPSTRSGPARA
jgi:hypothetical protein